MSEAFSIFSSRVRRAVWPEGEAETLSEIHKNHVKDALIDLQIKIPRLQEDHKDITSVCDTYYNCGATVFAFQDRAIIRRVYTVLVSDFCSKVYYQMIDNDQMDRVIEENCPAPIVAGSCVRCYEGGYLDLYYGDQYPDPYWKPNNRAVAGFSSLYRGSIRLFPAILPTEQVVVDWEGVKRLFADADVVEYDREAEQLVELYLKWQKQEEDCDTQASAIARQAYELRRGDLIHQYEKENRPARAVPESSLYSIRRI